MKKPIEKADIIQLILEINARRTPDQLARRVIKLQEECGELAEAYLGVTSSYNRKHKTWPDIREEAIDTALVALDVALTPTPEEYAQNRDYLDMYEEIRADIQRVVKRKLAKWARAQKKRGTAIT
jgi:hypothetical protein